MTALARPRVLMIANEHPWPANHGGRKRMARIAEALAVHVDLIVASAAPKEEPVGRPEDLDWVELPVVSVPRIQQVTRLREPFVARRLIAGSHGTLRDLATRRQPDVIYWSHSYLPAVRPAPFVGLNVRHVVEFPNIERRRFQSMAATGSAPQRASLRFEALKARRWEARVARSADAVVAINPGEAEELQRMSRRVITALNGFDSAPYVPSPHEPTVMVVGSWGYRPNADALERFLVQDWPRVVQAQPAAVLRIVGRGAESFANTSGVEPRGFVDDLSAEYAAASVVLAPAASGGGSQLKVAEALSHGRVVVGPTFLRREMRPDLPAGAIEPASDVAGALLRLLDNVPERHIVEANLHSACTAAQWAVIGANLADRLLELIH